MEAMQRLNSHLRSRLGELRKLKDEGHKIIGYTPGGFMPEELVHACGAVPVPVGLIRGGEHEPVLAATPYFPRFLDTFVRAQIGYRELAEEPLYQMIDLLVVPVTDINIRALSDSWEVYTDVEVFRFSVPRKKSERGFKYYLEGLNLLKERLEKLTGTKIKDEKLKEAIDSFNKMRQLLEEISLMRKSAYPPISGKDFILLNHASCLLDKATLNDILESLCQELRQQEKKELKPPRILLTGSTLAMGDYKILDLVEETGAAIVAEEFCEGVRHYWQRVETNGDLMEALADRYYRRRVPCAFFRPSRERIDFVLKLAKEFDVEGIVWYQLMYRESYDVEAYYFPKILERELNIPFIKIESDYDISEIGAFRTRIETFMEIIK